LKKLLTLLFLPWVAHAASIDLVFESCGVGGYYLVGACPCHLTAPLAGGNVTDVTADGSIVLAGANCTGDVYGFADITADPDPSHADCVAGTGATNAQTLSATGAGTYSFTGATDFVSLTAETSYQVAYCFVPDTNPNRITKPVLVSGAFSTLAAAGGGGTDLTGAGLFIALADAGNTDETPTGTAGTQTSGCTSMANSCSEFSHLGSLATGQNFYMAEGGVWEDKAYSVVHSGSSSDIAVVGCYFDEGDDDGNPVLCTNF